MVGALFYFAPERRGPATPLRAAANIENGCQWGLTSGEVAARYITCSTWCRMVQLQKHQKIMLIHGFGVLKFLMKRILEMNRLSLEAAIHWRGYCSFMVIRQTSLWKRKWKRHMRRAPALASAPRSRLCSDGKSETGSFTGQEDPVRRIIAWTWVGSRA
ncbi:uncharacterized protein [Lolium perenne]|uniref:uncharacterized protein isoform X2 n=1 Tax=Lolium perenne TaxID=4522 RepID=UPI003A994AE6